MRIALTIAVALVAGVLLDTSAARAGARPDARGESPGVPICWRRVPSPNGSDTLPNYLHGVDGDSPADVWTVGLDEGIFPNEALIEHWDGTAWTVSAQIFIGTGGTALNGVHAIASNDVWAVGYYNAGFPLIEHWDGSGWFISPTPIPGISHTLFGVAAASPNDVWAVGNY